MARPAALLAAAALQLGLASAQLGCLTRVTHVHYESVAAIDMVEFFYRDDSSELYDADGSGPSENDYAKHGRIVVPCDRYIRSVSWTDFASHGWQGRELDYSLADASGQEVSTVEQAAGYAPDCVDDEWAQNSMGGCLDPVVFDAPAGEAIVGLVWDGSGVLTGITSEPLPPPDSTAPLRSESTPIALSGFTLDGSATLDGEILKLTGVENSQTGTAFYPLWVHGTSGSEAITLRFEMYVGDGSGADGMCVNVGGNNLWALDYSAQRNAEDGIANGLALCFDGTRSSSLLVFLQSLKEVLAEWANSGDHGVTIFYGGEPVWENLGECGNGEGCEPISQFADATWHAVELNISPTASGGAVATFQLTTAGDRHGIPIIYHGFATIPAFSLPTPSFLGFTARTGGATNNHWVRAVSRETVCECSNGQPSFSTRSLRRSRCCRQGPRHPRRCRGRRCPWSSTRRPSRSRATRPSRAARSS